MKPIITPTEYTQAVNTAKYHNYLYFVQSAPVITDAEFDELYFAIDAYEQQHPDSILPDSPTQQPGSDLRASSHTIPHRYPMLSTKKIKADKSEVIKWMRSAAKAVTKIPPHYIYTEASEKFTIEWKYDGCSCSLVYQDGELIEASTRGDTKKNLGSDILLHVRNIPNIPQRIPGASGRIEVRGEIIMPFSHFDHIPAGTYSDPRTASSAILNTDTATPYDSELCFIAWQSIPERGARLRISEVAAVDLDIVSMSHDTMMECVADHLGFTTGGCEVVSMNTVEDAIWEAERQRKNLDFPTDGLVIKLNDTRLWEGMGRTEHHHKFCVAYKFAPLTSITTCRDIVITTGETGRRTPVAYFDPVTINGKTFNKASLGSEATMQEKGIRIGATIEVALANDVIPQVLRAL